jgi:hypothetical protein
MTTITIRKTRNLPFVYYSLVEIEESGKSVVVSGTLIAMSHQRAYTLQNSFSVLCFDHAFLSV